MIATVTLNPSIDYYIEVSQLSEGNSLSSTKNTFLAGGKGINVSRVLSNLGYSSQAIAFIGGFTGDFILSQEPDLIMPIPIQNMNRINTKIKTSSKETEIHGIAPHISLDEFNLLCEKIKSLAPSLEVLVLSGSVPSSLGVDAYKTIASLCPPSTKVIVDTRGKSLKECLSLPSIFLIKPNKDEIGELFGQTVETTEQGLEMALSLKKKNSIQNLILSLGAEGAYFLCEDKVFFADSLKGTLVSSVGAGDSVVAGFTASYLKTKDPIAAFTYGIACGAATAFSEGLCQKETVDQLVSHVKIKKII